MVLDPDARQTVDDPVSGGTGSLHVLGCLLDRDRCPVLVPRLFAQVLQHQRQALTGHGRAGIVPIDGHCGALPPVRIAFLPDASGKKPG
ncbi:hypothetical protein [Micromonospora sp. LOL_023]|uniref:hypothetical protein n=1 Tax=Micromonospora sp. LOL_023 TaxID=3345418 RepID=UPI003A88A378